MKKILLVIPLLLSYSSKGMEDPHSNINSTMESVWPGYLINELEVYTEILEGICEVADVLGKRKQTEEHGNQDQPKKAKRFECNKCGHLLSSQSHLNRHMEAHNTGKPFECDAESCQEKFKTQSRLSHHKKSVHDPKIVCGINGCTYETGLKAGLKRHKEQVHEKRKDYSCDRCDYICALQSTLKEHRETHNTGKPLECNAKGCQKKFKTEASLRMHKRNIHGHKKVCGINECQYKTGIASDLSKHKKRMHRV